MSPFTPKQVMPRDDRLFAIIGADMTQSIAEYEVSLLRPFPEDSIIHDAACGLGPVTNSILQTLPPKSIAIHATDLAPPMVGIYNMLSKSKDWPAEARVMDCQKLEFTASTFTHTFLSFGLPIIADPNAAAKEMYRTLQPGGTAVTAFWMSLPQGDSAVETRRVVWGPDARVKVEPHPRHNDPTFNHDLLVEAGFNSGDIKLYESTTSLPVEDLDEFACAIWSIIGEPVGGWKQEDEDRWDEAIEAYKKVLMQKKGFHVDGEGRIVLEGVAQIAIAKKEA
ncbi:unnamed protein product [Periconia digitata]|uniref:Methyltransferase domain-containing protein n=1 Tax=Periconia digitata TaxID=1303443 RepID=A0A9W4UEI4_9PLEO|nr:unnamed protein product [Periconia digitata]